MLITVSPLDDGSHLGDAFVRVMRLFWMGDFDMFELEGVDGTVKGTITNQISVDLTEDDGDHNPKIKYGMRLFALFAVFLGPILFMNIFITVLGDAYSKAKDEINERFVRYRTNCVKILLLRKLFCRKYLNLCKGRHKQVKLEGVWFRLPNYCLEESSADDPITLNQLQFVQTDLTEKINESVGTMQKQIEDSENKIVKLIEDLGGVMRALSA